MYSRKPFHKLTLKDNFMFCAVMVEPENCRPLLERVLGKSIGKLTVDKEKCLIYNPNFKSVRLDVYARDEKSTHYDVEMQVVEPKDILRRSRYYHSQMDLEALNAGNDYENLPECFVIFICDFDPFGRGKYCYFMQQYCRETGLPVDNGSFTIFLSTCGKNRDEVPKELADLLDFIHSEYREDQQESEDVYIRQLQNSVTRIKDSREMGVRYMQFLEMLNDEREEGRKEGHKEGCLETQKKHIIKVISSKTAISDELRQTIFAENDSEKLEKWFSYALSDDAIEEIEEKIRN